MKNSARFFGKLLATVIISSSLLLTAAYSQESGATAPKKSAPKKSASAPAATAGAEPFIGKPDKIKWVQFAPSIEHGSVQPRRTLRFSIAIRRRRQDSAALASRR